MEISRVRDFWIAVDTILKNLLSICSSAALSVSLVGSILELAGIFLWNSFKWCIRRSFNIKAPSSWIFSPLQHGKSRSKETILSSIEAGLPLFPGRALSGWGPDYKLIGLMTLSKFFPRLYSFLSLVFCCPSPGFSFPLLFFLPLEVFSPQFCSFLIKSYTGGLPCCISCLKK